MMKPIVRGSPHPKSFDLSSAKVSANSPVAESSTPR